MLVDDKLIGSLKQDTDVLQMEETSSKTVDTFFGEEVGLILLGSALALVFFLVTYGLVDQFLIRKLISKRKSHMGAAATMQKEKMSNCDNSCQIEQIKEEIGNKGKSS